MKNKIAFALLISVFFAACNDNLNEIPFVDCAIHVNLPEEMKTVDPSGIELRLKNVNTGQEIVLTTDNQGNAYFYDLGGIYNIELRGTKTYSFTDNDGTIKTVTVSLSGLSENIVLSSHNSLYQIYAHIQIESKGWVIKELYSAGSKTPNGGSYSKDQFVEIYNNTDTVMYADGLAIGETRHQTTSNALNPYTDDMNRKTFLWTVYSIEGSGKDYPVEPGKSIIIAPQPIDHRANGSIDLSEVSDFQWFDASGNLSIDVPSVPNLKKSYSYSNTIWVVTVQMNRGFVVFKLPENISMEKFIEENTDVRLNNAGTQVISIAVPNEYICDAIELGYRDRFYYKSLSSSLDVGSSYTLETYNGKSIRRKIETVKPDGRIVYKDTNNSSIDFLTGQTPAPKQFPIE